MRRAILLLPLFLVGCSLSSSGSLTGIDDDDDDDDDAADDDDDTADDWDDGVPDGFAEDGDGSRFFPSDRLLPVDIELPEASWDALREAPYEYVLGRVTVDGLRINDVGIRLRGRIGSFREIHEKPKWRLDFNRLVDGRRVEGLEALSLDNNVVDCSGLKQMLGFHALALAGVPASRGGFARVTVNGEDYGVYNTVEVQDDRFLVDRFVDGDGTLYDGAYTWFGEWNVQFADFTSGASARFELEEGPDVGHADVLAVTDALGAAELSEFATAMAGVWDVEAFQRYAAAEYWIGQNDGYVLNRNNNRLYFDPTDGLGRFISYDLDYAFLWSPWDGSWEEPAGRLARVCFSDPGCWAGVRAAAGEVLAVLEEADLEATFDGWDAVTGDAARQDRNDECGPASVDEGREQLRGWIRARGDAMRAQFGLPPGP